MKFAPGEIYLWGHLPVSVVIDAAIHGRSRDDQQAVDAILDRCRDDTERKAVVAMFEVIYKSLAAKAGLSRPPPRHKALAARRARGGGS